MKHKKICFGGMPSIRCIWCGYEVPCIGHVPTHCPHCGRQL